MVYRNLVGYCPHGQVWDTAIFRPRCTEAQKNHVSQSRAGGVYMCPDLPHIPSLSQCKPPGLRWTVNSARALCFPMIKGATDYHRAIFTGTYWLEQAGRGGPLNIWANEDDLIADVYKRGDGKSYVEGSHFFFMLPVE